MKKLFFAVALCLPGLLGLGCTHAGSKKLEGRWKGTHAEGMTSDRQDLGNAFASATEVVAKGNQIAIATPSGRPLQATYFVDSEDKTSVVIHTDKDGPLARETFLFSDDGKTMTWKIDDHRSIVFERNLSTTPP